MRPESTEYKSHRIAVVKEGDKLVPVLDGRRLRYGQFPDGLYYLEDYAFDWSEDLEELVRKYVDHLDRAKKTSAKAVPTDKKER